MNTLIKTISQRRRLTAILLAAVFAAVLLVTYHNASTPAHTDIRRYPPFQDARFGQVYLVSYIDPGRSSKERVWEMHTMDGKLVDDSTFFAEKRTQHTAFRFPFTPFPAGGSRLCHIFRVGGKLHILCEEKDASGRTAAPQEMVIPITHQPSGVLDEAKRYFLDRQNERLLSEGKEISDTGT